jgi:hypothetical protein
MHHLVVQAMYWLCFALQGNQFDHVASSFTFSISVLHADVYVCSGCVWLTVGFVGRSAICHSVNECAVTAQSANHSMTEKNGGVCQGYVIVLCIWSCHQFTMERAGCWNGIPNCGLSSRMRLTQVTSRIHCLGCSTKCLCPLFPAATLLP